MCIRDRYQRRVHGESQIKFNYLLVNMMYSQFQVPGFHAPLFHQLKPPRQIGNSMDVILEPSKKMGGLYLGNVNAARDLNELKSKKIEVVLSLLEYRGVQYLSLIHI
eukprot:TRINITY_DN2095_c0_g1_i23.p1 TRINITY_DN2095_c0_g1~~TRINITY_DN2095_c0_g1_i23.p1  ORF type:complete len:107 (+),score=22.46 TRINITY_DN2095_c0_g1_i23:66-386(+)